LKRRKFISSTIVSGIALSLIPGFAFSKTPFFSFEELIGKGDPELFGDGYQLRKEAHLAFLEMQQAAKKDGIAIKIVSSYRNYAHQKKIWERKYRNYVSRGLSPIECIKKIIEYSTIPGTSRHHWGTDVDIVDGNFINTSYLLSAFNFKKGQPFYKLKIWLEANAENFNYHIVYTNKEDRNGFKYEPWHYSYKPLSFDYLKQFKDLDILEILKGENFEGSEHFTETFIQSYFEEHILDINPDLLP